MPFHLKVTKADSGATSGTSDDPRTPVRRNSWELSSLDPSTWPVFGITNEGIGITTDDGQTLDVEKSADFGFDRTLDGHQLASIWEGIESGMLGDPSFTSTGLADALTRAEEQNESFRHLCWDLISLARDLEDATGFQEPPNHQQLLEEARRCLELVRERLELRKQLQLSAEAVPEMEVPAPESTLLPSRGGSLKLVNPEPGIPGPGSCRLAFGSFSPVTETRSLVASCSAPALPALPWSACCPVARMLPAPAPPLMPQFQTHSPQMVSRVGDSCVAQVPRFSSDGPIGNSAQYPVEPVTRGVSPLREGPLSAQAPSGIATVSFTGYPRPMATQSGVPALTVSQRQSPKWIGSWIRRSSCYEVPKVLRMSSFEGATQQC